MGTTVTGKLNKSAQQFQAGESVGFGIRIGVQYYDRVSKNKEWTNYKAVIFAKAQGQINFLQDNLIEGAIVEITGDRQKIEVYDGDNGTVYSIEILDAKLGYVSSGGGNAQQSPQYSNMNAPAPAHSGAAPSRPNASAPRAAQSHSRQPDSIPGLDDFDDDLPF
jgi:single-strand DNA-binding protein